MMIHPGPDINQDFFAHFAARFVRRRSHMRGQNNILQPHQTGMNFRRMFINIQSGPPNTSFG